MNDTTARIDRTARMRILIIGTGSMGRGISTRLLAGAHDIELYNPDRAKAEALAAELTNDDSGGSVRAATELAQAIDGSEVVILASWYGVNLEVARDLADELDGKIVVDISNPLNDSYDGLVTEGGLSAAERISEALGAGARVVKAFNTTFAPTLVDGDVGGVPLDVFLAGDDEGAKEAVAGLARDGGLNPVDVGGLVRARQLEALALLGITLQSRLDTGFRTGWKLLMPDSASDDR